MCNNSAEQIEQKQATAPRCSPAIPAAQAQKKPATVKPSIQLQQVNAQSPTPLVLYEEPEFVIDYAVVG